MTSVLLGIDGGQTGTRAVLADLDGRVLSATAGDAYDHPQTQAGAAAACATLRELVGALDTSSFPVAGAAVGLTSVDSAECAEARRVAAVVCELTGSNRVLVVPDRVAALAGSTARGHGIVVLAGGGAIVAAVGASGEELVLSGYGYRVGDDGSAVDIGRRAVAAALRGWEGRGAVTALTDVVAAEFRIDHPRGILDAIYEAGFRRSRFAALAPAVLDAAAAGDAVADAIVDAAAEELAAAAAAAAGRLYSAGEVVPVFLAGGLLEGGTVLTRRVAEKLVCRVPEARPSAVRHASLVGTLVLARRAARLDVDDEWVVRVRDDVAAALG